MSESLGRAQFFKRNPTAYAWAKLNDATDAQNQNTLGHLAIPEGHFKNKTAVIVGAGVGGLCTAYELLSQKTGMQVTVLEAANRVGGRCLTLRTGDSFTEDADSCLTGSKKGVTQTVRFSRPVGDAEPYLNAGPGRIPTSHKRLLGYLRDFGVEIEVYLMNSMANLVQMDGGPSGALPIVYRRIDHNVRGWLAQMVYQNAETLIKNLISGGIKSEDRSTRVAELKSLMQSFGELNTEGKYVPDPGEDGFENARSRAGFEVLPSVDVGDIAEPLSLDSLLASKFWEKTRFYQPVDFFWQQSIFHPVGGMDRVQHAFAQKVAALGGEVRLNTPVQHIGWDEKVQKYIIQTSKVGTNEVDTVHADFVFCNLAIPFLEKILCPSLQGRGDGAHFNSAFSSALHKVYDAQRANNPVDRFLQPTAKVGWQADRKLWQGRSLQLRQNRRVLPESEIGVVPIFGGISMTDHPITQIWYPSTDYNGKLGTLTGAYNFEENAIDFGNMCHTERLEKAREGARRFDTQFADGLEKGVSIAWHKMPYIKGGWARWQTLGDDAVDAFNNIAAGTGVDGCQSPTKKNFFIIGDQISSLPGWMEGAIAAALNALQIAAFPDERVTCLSVLPDPKIMVQGI